jgi:hypothetical protein
MMGQDPSRHDLLTALRILEANGIIDFNGHASQRAHQQRPLGAQPAD